MKQTTITTKIIAWVHTLTEDEKQAK